MKSKRSPASLASKERETIRLKIASFRNWKIFSNETNTNTKEMKADN